MKIGEAIRKTRQEQDATLEKIALAAGTDAANLSRIERGKQGFTPEMIEKIAKALKLPVSSLYSRVEQDSPAYRVVPAHEESAAKGSTAELFHARLDRLTPENQRLVLDFVDTLLKWQKWSQTNPRQRRRRDWIQRG
ncbi:MAG: helix-turn-helix transcriptional regulator [Sterolibacterium sp.]